MLLVFSVLDFCLPLPQAQVFIMSQLLCLGPIRVFLVTGLLHLGCERGWPGLEVGCAGAWGNSYSTSVSGALTT